MWQIINLLTTKLWDLHKGCVNQRDSIRHGLQTKIGYPLNLASTFCKSHPYIYQHTSAQIEDFHTSILCQPVLTGFPLYTYQLCHNNKYYKGWRIRQSLYQMPTYYRCNHLNMFIRDQVICRDRDSDSETERQINIDTEIRRDRDTERHGDKDRDRVRQRQRHQTYMEPDHVDMHLKLKLLTSFSPSPQLYKFTIMT